MLELGRPISRPHQVNSDGAGVDATFSSIYATPPASRNPQPVDGL
jgi:hypothetical protein